MHEYPAARLVLSAGYLNNLQFTRLDGFALQDSTLRLTEGAAKNTAEDLTSLIEECDFLGLSLTKISAERLLEKVVCNNPSLTKDEYKTKALDIIFRFNDEMGPRKLLYIAPEKLGFYDNARKMFGDTVAGCFPSSLDEIEEAGKCLALGRGTACVFHLMRSLEPVLNAISTELGIVKHSPTWSAYLSAFDKSIAIKFPNQTKLDKENVDFYSDVKGNFYAVKDGWRNPSMHDIAKIYTEEQAENIFNAVKGLMQKISEKMKEPIST